MMKSVKKILAVILVVSMVVGLVPRAQISNAEETAESTLNETLLFSDTFDEGTEWNIKTPAPVGYWRLNNASYTGTRDGVTELGYQTTSARNLYCSKSNDGKLADVHMKADVCVTSAICYGGHPQYQFLVARATTATATDGIAFGFKTVRNATKSSLVVCDYDGSNTAGII